MADDRIQVASTSDYLGTSKFDNADGDPVHSEWTSPALGPARTTPVDVNVSASGATVLVAGVGSQITRIWRLLLHAAGAVNVTFKSGATTLPGMIVFESAGDVILDLDGEPWFSTAVAADLSINLSAAVAVKGVVYHTQQA